MNQIANIHLFYALPKPTLYAKIVLTNFFQKKQKDYDFRKDFLIK